MPSIADTLLLPCGAELKNRLAKAAMTEGLADADNRATERHVRLYRRWAEGGAGLLLTGNVQIDRRHLERPGNVAIMGEQPAEALAALRRWSAAGTGNNTHFWMQIAHAGRQTPAAVNPHPLAPSAVPLALPGKAFGMPREMTPDDIAAAIAGFAHAARIARETGFTGVQIHAAHGYLLSTFLNPRANRRRDEWGGSLENRARALLESVRAVRRAVGNDFPVSVKLNSADFQKGGFTLDECVTVAGWLAELRIDLLEISGGNYEQPKMAGLGGVLEAEAAQRGIATTLLREAYFASYAKRIAEAVELPLMVTGGFRTRAGMEEALAAGAADVVGLARPLCVATDGPQRLLGGESDALPDYEKSLSMGPGWLSRRSPFRLVRSINGWGIQGWFCLQLIRMGEGREPDPGMGVFSAFRNYARNERLAAQRLRV